MTETKIQHTLGPWRTQHTAGHDTHGQSAIYAETTGKDIAVVYDGETNGPLIAAAPDLYDAVYHVLVASEDGGDMNDIDWNMLRAAIAKAKGETQ